MVWNSRCLQVTSLHHRRRFQPSTPEPSGRPSEPRSYNAALEARSCAGTAPHQLIAGPSLANCRPVNYTQGRAQAGAGRPAGRTTAAPEGGPWRSTPPISFPPPPPSGRVGAAPGAAASPPMSAAERPSRGPIGRESSAPRPMGASLPAPRRSPLAAAGRRPPNGRAGGGGEPRAAGARGPLRSAAARRAPALLLPAAAMARPRS